MAAGKFGAGRTTAVAASREQLSSAHMMTGNLPVVPSRASLSASGRAASPSTIHSGAPTAFYGSQSTSRPESFQQQTAHLQQSMQQSHFSPVTAGGRSNGTASNGPSRGASESRGTSSAAAGGKSSAGHGIQPSRETNSSATSGRRDRSSNAESSTNRGEPNRSEWKTFTPPSRSNRRVCESRRKRRRDFQPRYKWQLLESHRAEFGLLARSIRLWVSN